MAKRKPKDKRSKKKSKKTKKGPKKSTRALLEDIRAEQRKIVREERKLQKMGSKIFEEERKIVHIEHRILEEEQELLAKIGKIKVKKTHILDFFKVVGGALVGTSFGSQFLNATELAGILPWMNVVGILILSLAIGGALIYKSDQKHIKKMKSPGRYIVLRLLYIWLIATGVGGLSVFLFLTEPVSSVALLKSMLVGSYPALAGAIGFNFI